MVVFHVFLKLGEIEASFWVAPQTTMCYAAFDPLGRNFGQLFGFSLSRYSYFNCSSGWPKFQLGLWSIPYSSTHILVFCRCGRNFGQLFLFLHMSAIVSPSNTPYRNLGQLAMVIVHEYYTLHSYIAAFLPQH